MTNDEALEALDIKRIAVNNAINDVVKYKAEAATWLDSHKTAIKTSVKANAVIVDADLSTWDGADA
tara:strand:+ start:635 stop:832 length:198 start_codon:yes stop_codon:yes gene_type:complete